MESGSQVRTTSAIPNKNAAPGTLLSTPPPVSVISEVGATSVRPRADTSVYSIQNLDRSADHTGNGIVNTQYNTLE